MVVLCIMSTQDECDELRAKVEMSPSRRPTMDVHDISFQQEQQLVNPALGIELANMSAIEHENLLQDYEHLKHAHAEDLRHLKAEHSKALTEQASKASFLHNLNVELQSAIEERTTEAEVPHFT